MEDSQNQGQSGQPQPQTPPVTPPPPLGDVPKEQWTMGMLCHLLGAFTSFLGPLVIWLLKKDEMAFVDREGKEALNFQITVMIVVLPSMLLAVPTCGVTAILGMLAGLANMILGIIGAVKASGGESYTYPFAIRLVK